ncbi:MAG: cytochrome c, partial [Actinobacteria bacterium]|nr:cytochrome c [Actinomycetota bacterium]
MATTNVVRLSRILRGSAIVLGLCALASRASAQELRDQYHQAPRDTVSQEVYDGWKQFNLNCARCHGEDVQGTTIAPHLILSL